MCLLVVYLFCFCTWLEPAPCCVPGIRHCYWWQTCGTSHSVPTRTHSTPCSPAMGTIYNIYLGCPLFNTIKMPVGIIKIITLHTQEKFLFKLTKTNDSTTTLRTLLWDWCFKQNLPYELQSSCLQVSSLYWTFLAQKSRPRVKQVFCINHPVIWIYGAKNDFFL